MTRFRAKALFLLSFITIGLLSSCSTEEKIAGDNPPLPIVIGWQIPWATEGQLVQALKHTDILKNNGLKGDFKGFSYGAPLNEAALAGAVDVVLTGDQPAITLISKDSQWKIIGRLMYNNVSLYAPPKSEINTLSDLRGKTVAMPFGAAAQRLAYLAEKDAGLDPNKDVKNINLGIYEQNDLVRDTHANKWGDIDALAGFDPTPIIFEENGLIKILKTGKVVSVILMKQNYIDKYPNAPAQLLEAFKSAYDYYRLNKSQVDNWFIEEAKLTISPSVLAKAASVEPNLFVSGKDNIRLGFNADDYKLLQEASDFLFSQGMIKKEVIVKDFIKQ